MSPPQSMTPLRGRGRAGFPPERSPWTHTAGPSHSGAWRPASHTARSASTSASSRSCAAWSRVVSSAGASGPPRCRASARGAPRCVDALEAQARNAASRPPADAGRRCRPASVLPFRATATRTRGMGSRRGRAHCELARPASIGHGPRWEPRLSFSPCFAAQPIFGSAPTGRRRAGRSPLVGPAPRLECGSGEGRRAAAAGVARDDARARRATSTRLVLSHPQRTTNQSRLSSHALASIDTAAVRRLSIELSGQVLTCLRAETKRYSTNLWVFDIERPTVVNPASVA